MANPTPLPLSDRILRRVVVDANGCWVWQGMRDYGGYGRMSIGSKRDGTNRSKAVHLVAYELWKAPIPEGFEVDHICENPPCCNPEHMEAVTSAENQRRKGWRMTTCRRGHPRTPENAYRKSDGAIQCRACQQDKRKELRAAKDAARD